VFADLKRVSTLVRDTIHLASICTAPVKSIPTLEDFLAAKNIPTTTLTLPVKNEVHVGAYDVVDATDLSRVAKQMGNRVELVGKVAKVHVAKTKYGQLYCFIFFNDSRQAVKLNIWSEGLATLASLPSRSWVGTWLSVQGLVDPPFSGEHGTSSSVTITSKSQIREITEAEARHRLQGSDSGAQKKKTGNRSILEGLGTVPPSDPNGSRSGIYTPPLPVPPAAPRTKTKNQAILDSIRPSAVPAPQSASTPPSPIPSRSSHSSPSPSPTSRPSSRQEIGFGSIILIATVLLGIIRAFMRR
jgi:hypothetical protein